MQRKSFISMRIFPFFSYFEGFPNKLLLHDTVLKLKTALCYNHLEKFSHATAHNVYRECFNKLTKAKCL